MTTYKVVVVTTTMTAASPLRPDQDLLPLPETPGGFKTILADPPWRFTNRTGKVAPEHRRLDTEARTLAQA